MHSSQFFPFSYYNSGFGRWFSNPLNPKKQFLSLYIYFLKKSWKEVKTYKKICSCSSFQMVNVCNNIYNFLLSTVHFFFSPSTSSPTFPFSFFSDLYLLFSFTSFVFLTSSALSQLILSLDSWLKTLNKAGINWYFFSGESVGAPIIFSWKTL